MAPWFLLLLVLVGAPGNHELSFADRVAAQRRIEGVYYSHLTGATRPFEQAITPEILDKTV